MEILFKQHEPYGCGLYALANLFECRNIVSGTRLSESKRGNTTRQLNAWLQTDFDYNIDSLYAHFDSVGFPLPPKGTMFMTQNDEDVVPLLIDTSVTLDGRKHMVSALADNKGNLVIMDSLRDEVVVTQWEHLVSGALYNFIIAIYGITKDNGEWLTLQKSEYAKKCFYNQCPHKHIVKIDNHTECSDCGASDE